MDRNLNVIGPRAEAVAPDFLNPNLSSAFIESSETFARYFENIDRITNEVRFLEEFYRNCGLPFYASFTYSKSVARNAADYREVYEKRIYWHPEEKRIMWSSTWFHVPYEIDLDTDDYTEYYHNWERKPLLQCSAIIRAEAYPHLPSLIEVMKAEADIA